MIKFRWSLVKFFSCFSWESLSRYLFEFQSIMKDGRVQHLPLIYDRTIHGYEFTMIVSRWIELGEKNKNLTFSHQILTMFFFVISSTLYIQYYIVCTKYLFIWFTIITSESHNTTITTSIFSHISTPPHYWNGLLHSSSTVFSS